VRGRGQETKQAGDASAAAAACASCGLNVAAALLQPLFQVHKRFCNICEGVKKF